MSSVSHSSFSEYVSLLPKIFNELDVIENSATKSSDSTNEEVSIRVSGLIKNILNENNFSVTDSDVSRIYKLYEDQKENDNKLTVKKRKKIQNTVDRKNEEQNKRANSSDFSSDGRSLFSHLAPVNPPVIFDFLVDLNKNNQAQNNNAHQNQNQLSNNVDQAPEAGSKSAQISPDIFLPLLEPEKT